VHKDDRAIRLPSGRRIWYHDVTPGSRITFKDHTRNGVRTDTYGGRLSENVTQGVARDLLGEALVRLHRNDFTVVGHVHDEILLEGGDVDAVRAVMVESPAWATDLPIDAEGFSCYRYRKG
jgi:DNA polymerase